MPDLPSTFMKMNKEGSIPIVAANDNRLQSKLNLNRETMLKHIASIEIYQDTYLYELIQEVWRIKFAANFIKYILRTIVVRLDNQ
jgi:hypothetical protein